MLFRQAHSVSVWLLSWLYFIHLTAVPVLFLLYATVFFLFFFTFIYSCVLSSVFYTINEWMKNTRPTSAQWCVGTFSKRHTAMPLLSPVLSTPVWYNALPLEKYRLSLKVRILLLRCIWRNMQHGIWCHSSFGFTCIETFLAETTFTFPPQRHWSFDTKIAPSVTPVLRVLTFYGFPFSS